MMRFSTCYRTRYLLVKKRIRCSFMPTYVVLMAPLISGACRIL